MIYKDILCSNIDPHSHVTGINVAAYGYTEDHGKFFVEDYCYATLSDPVSLPVVSENKCVWHWTGRSKCPVSLATFDGLLDGAVGRRQGPNRHCWKQNRTDVKIFLLKSIRNHDIIDDVYSSKEILKTLALAVNRSLDDATAVLNHMGSCSLIEACSSGDILTVKKLLDEERDVNEVTEEGESLLSLACSSGYYEPE